MLLRQSGGVPSWSEAERGKGGEQHSLSQRTARCRLRSFLIRAPPPIRKSGLMNPAEGSLAATGNVPFPPEQRSVVLAPERHCPSPAASKRAVTFCPTAPFFPGQNNPPEDCRSHGQEQADPERVSGAIQGGAASDGVGESACGSPDI